MFFKKENIKIFFLLDKILKIIRPFLKKRIQKNSFVGDSHSKDIFNLFYTN